MSPGKLAEAEPELAAHLGKCWEPPRKGPGLPCRLEPAAPFEERHTVAARGYGTVEDDPAVSLVVEEPAEPLRDGPVAGA